MHIYLTGTAASSILALICSRVERKKNGAAYCFISALLSSLPLALIAAVRFNVGQDYPAYAHYFIQVRNGAGRDREPLFYLLNKAAALFSDDYVSIFVITSFLFVILVLVQVFRDSPYPALSVIMFVCAGYYFDFLNGTRQMLGCAILICSLTFVCERKILPFLLLVITAGLIHTTCFLFAPVWFFGHLGKRKNAVLIGTLAVFLMSDRIAAIVNTLIGETLYSMYIGSEFETGKQGLVTLMINIVLFIFAYVFYDDSNKSYGIYFTLQAMTLCVSALTGKIVLINRLGWMFGMPAIILIPKALKNVRNRLLLSAGMVGIPFIYLVYLLYTVGVTNSNNVLPYMTVFSRISG